MRVNVVRFPRRPHRVALERRRADVACHRSRGLIQSRGGEVTEIRPGDTIYTAPSEWHWHGAAPDHFMTHIAMWKGLGEAHGPESKWGVLVTDKEYHAQPASNARNRETEQHANHNIGQHGPRGRRHRLGVHGHDPRLRHEDPT